MSAILISAGLAARPAQAAYVVTLEQEGANVVATGSGTLDLTGLSFNASGCCGAGEISPNIGFVMTGEISSVDLYIGPAGPASFGSGGLMGANSTGDIIGIEGSASALWVPLGYISGSVLSDSATYYNSTLDSLGVTPGPYVWTWAAMRTRTASRCRSERCPCLNRTR